MDSKWISTVITLASLLVSLGVMWGMLKSSVAHLTAQVDRLSDTVDKNEELMRDFQEEIHVRLAENDLALARARRKQGRRK